MVYSLVLFVWTAIMGFVRLFHPDRGYLLQRARQSHEKVEREANSKRSPRFLIHAVSVGETKAILPLYTHLQKTYKNAYFAITSTTKTGHEATKKLLKGADAYLPFPIDFKRSVRKLFNYVSPDYVILSEGDLWLNFLLEAKKRGSHVFIASAKISDKSTKRMKKVPAFTHKIFSCVDAIAAQSKGYAAKFEELGVQPKKLYITGNLKYDEPFYKKASTRGALGLKPRDKVIVIGSTHAPEERLILEALGPLMKADPRLHLIFVPRHPERFDKVEALFKASGYPFKRYSKQVKSKSKKVPQLILVDQMGLLCDLYTIADISIVAGSFTPKVGGHNIYEPLFARCALIFGPFMQTQLPMCEKVLKANAGLQVSITSLKDSVQRLLESSDERKALIKRGKALVKEGQGSAKNTLKALKESLSKIKT